MAVSQSEGAFVTLPDPGRTGTLDELVEGLRRLKVWAGAPSYDTITARINAAWTATGRPRGELAGRTTVADCFRPGRRRLNADLVVAVVQALHPDTGYVAQWRQALQVITGQAQAASQVRAQDRLPPDLVGFTGRTAELDQLHRALRHGIVDGGALGVAAIAGMAGVGKTQLAVHAGHQLARDNLVERVLFVNLRGFDPDPGQPPADPASVLDGFLRLLGVSGQRIPHDLPARIAAYRDRLAGTRTLIVLDNAATADQIRPLLPDTAGCPLLVTSRRSLTSLLGATHVAVNVFTPDEARQCLSRATPGVPVGQDPDAAVRIAFRCGHLPLALGLIAAHIQARPSWTLTDHADRLDEHHHTRRLDSGVQLALDLSYQQLPADRQRLLRLAALHPGQEIDACAAAALTDTDLPTARIHLHQLCGDHLLQPTTPDRYTFHDLVRAHAANKASDEDPAQQRRAALTRLFDYYLATTATAMDTLYPGETSRRHRISRRGTHTPVLADPDTALAWLDTERPTLVMVAAHTAANGWPAHTTRLSATLYRYLIGGYCTDALTVHGHALRAARRAGDPTGQARALTCLGLAHTLLSRYGPAAEHLQQALALFRQADDATGQAHALASLGVVEERLGRYQSATEHLQQALTLHKKSGDRTGEAFTHNCLGVVEMQLSRHRQATDHHEQALTQCRQTGDNLGKANALSGLGRIKVQLGLYPQAGDHLRQALALYRKLGARVGEARALDGLGTLHTHLGQTAQATEHHRQALAIFRETGDRDGEAWALNGLGEAARAVGHPTDALTHHTNAIAIATDISARDQQARAHTGLGHAHHTLANSVCARRHYGHALTLYTSIGRPDADKIRADLAAIDDREPVV